MVRYNMQKILLNLLDILGFFLLLIMTILFICMYLPASHYYASLFVIMLGGHQYAHFFIGAMVPLCLGFLLRIYRYSRPWQGLFWLGSLMLFAADEIMQALSPLRHSQFADFGWSALGWGFACCIWWFGILSKSEMR